MSSSFLYPRLDCDTSVSQALARGQVIRQSVERTVEPAESPVSLVEMKEWVAYLAPDQDTLLAELIDAATIDFEKRTGTQIISATYRSRMDRFPAGGYPIVIPKPPVSSITSLSYLDQAGATQTLVEGTDFEVNYDAKPARIQILPTNTDWPVHDNRIGTVTMVFVSGYANRAAVPKLIKVAVKMTAAFWFRNREDMDSEKVPAYVQSIARKYRVNTLSPMPAGVERY